MNREQGRSRKIPYVRMVDWEIILSDVKYFQVNLIAFLKWYRDQYQRYYWLRLFESTDRHGDYDDHTRETSPDLYYIPMCGQNRTCIVKEQVWVSCLATVKYALCQGDGSWQKGVRKPSSQSPTESENQHIEHSNAAIHSADCVHQCSTGLSILYGYII